VILSPQFFQKPWTQLELDGLFTVAPAVSKNILPIWHNVTFDEVRRNSPILAQKFALRTDQGLEVVVQGVLKVLAADKGCVVLQPPPVGTPTEIEQFHEGNRWRGVSEVKFRLAFKHTARFEWDFSFPYGTTFIFSVDGKTLRKGRFGLAWNNLSHDFVVENISCTFVMSSRAGFGSATLLVGDTWLWHS